MEVNVVRELASQFMGEVSKASAVRIGTHLNPDGDTLGSALALSFFLDALKIQNEVLCSNHVPGNLLFLPGCDRIHDSSKLIAADLGIVVDMDSLERLGRVKSSFLDIDRLIVIDHHVPHDAPGDLRIVDTAVPATALIVFRLLQACGAAITPDMAQCLMTGVVTDTGSFRFRNTTPETLSAAAEMLDLGADIVRIAEEVYQTKPLAAMRLLGVMLSKMQLACSDRIAWASIALSDFESVGAQDEHTEGLSNEMLSVETVQISAILREPKIGSIRVSLRSRGNYDVSSVARQFGGGGHRNAAGCTFHTTLKEAESHIVEALKACLASC